MDVTDVFAVLLAVVVAEPIFSLLSGLLVHLRHRFPRLRTKHVLQHPVHGQYFGFCRYKQKTLADAGLPEEDFARSQLCPGYRRKTPDAIVQEILKIKAMLPPSGYGSGARMVAMIFNRRHADDEVPASISKSTVAKYLRLHKEDVLRLRRELKHQIPPPQPKNRLWGMDLTGKSERQPAGNQAVAKVHTIFGVVDHGSRACLALETVRDKSSLALMKGLIDLIERYGKPKAIRTDNEAVFNSRLFKLGLTILGIEHQQSELHCPWQNGRIERLFGTLKDRLQHIKIADSVMLDDKLREFRFWYNHVRPHQNIRGLTPAERWSGTRQVRCKSRWFTGWDGLLAGEFCLD